MGWNISQSVCDHWKQECKLACDSEVWFTKFRGLDYIRHVTENKDNPDTSLETWEAACLLNPSIADKLPVISECDQLGNPRDNDCIIINGYRISGSTTYAILHFAQMEWLFGPLAGMDIVEIGGGFGNMGHLFYLLGKVRSYTGFDLTIPSKLQNKFMTRQGWNAAFPNLGDPEKDKYDLVYSSCSLSELDIDGRTEYTDRVLCRSTRGFHIWNWDFNDDQTVKRVIAWFDEFLSPVKTAYVTDLPRVREFEPHTVNMFPWHPNLPMFAWGY